jgi:uncharacterized protein (DUF58 family)
MFYSYALIAYDLFLGGVLAGLWVLIYSAMLWVLGVYDFFRYGKFFAWN